MTISREDPHFWDVRTLERRVRKGHLNKKDIEKHLKSLPDVADKGQAPDLDAVEEPFHDEGSNGVSSGDGEPSVE
jgi:hypothetical protein